MKNVKRILALMLVTLMCANLLPLSALADEVAKEPEEKFVLKVSSVNKGKTGAVTGTVYDNYEAVLVVDNAKVNMDNISIYAMMQNVESLGVEGKREYSKSIETGLMSEDADLTVWIGNLLLGKVDGTQIVADCDGKEVTYTLKRTAGEKEPTVVTATPNSEEAARAAWHNMVNSDNFAYGTKSDDSYIVIANGSSLQLGKETLVFEESYGEMNLVLDKFTKDNLENIAEEIRRAVTVGSAEEAAYTFTLKAGTELAISSSYAKLLKDVTVTLSGENVGLSSLDHVLSGLRDAKTQEDYVALIVAVKNAIDAVGGNTVNVGIKFAEPKTTKDFKFRMQVSSVASDDSVGYVTAAVGSDYGTDIAIHGEKVNWSNVTLGLTMKDVASLGVTRERNYIREIKTGLGNSDAELAKVSALLNILNNTTIVGKVGDKKVTYTFEQVDAKNATFNPDSEEAARAVWQAIVGTNVTASTKKDDDSYIVIAKGSSLQVGDMILDFEEDYEGNLKLDNFSDLDALNKTIRGAVSYHKVEEGKEINNIVIKLARNTELAVSSSTAVLKNCAVINITGEAVTEENITEINALLTQLQEGRLSGGLTAVLGRLAGMVTGHTTTVEFKFGHEMVNEVKTVKDATCTEKGREKNVQHCDICGYQPTGSSSWSTNPLGHILKEPHHEEVPATCTKDGVEAYWECERCGELFSDKDGVNKIEEPVVIPALGHNYGTPIYAWTGDNSEVTATVVCDHCNEGEEGHEVTETVTPSGDTVASTCDKDGNAVYTAEFENELFETQTKIVVINATGHTPGEEHHEKEVAPTCTAEGGYDVVVRCTVCDAIITTSHVTVPAAGHKYDAVVTEPTCVDQGYTTYTCSVCGDTYRGTFVPATGVHSYVGVVTDPTCEDQGYTTYTCSVCGDSYVGTFVPATGHDYAVTYTWADDNSSVTATAICEHDDTHTATETVATTNEVTTAATTTAPGVRTYTAVFTNDIFTTQTATEEIAQLPAPTPTPTPTPTPSDDVEIEDEEVPLADLPFHEAYIVGNGDGTFNPDGNLTRAEAATMLAKLSDGFDAEESYTNDALTDVTEDQWYYKYVSYVYNAEIITGNGDGTFTPEENITREAFMVMVAKFLKLEALDTEATFTDIADASDWAKGYISALQTAGIVVGDEGTCKPTSEISRAEAVTILNRALDRVPKADLVVEENPFADVKTGDWYYAQVMEAAIEHFITDYHTEAAADAE